MPALFGEPMRLACQFCDRDDADGVYAIPDGWTGTTEARQSCEDFREAWWTHIGVCPNCSADVTHRQSN
jgi:hypothetical protein